MTSRNVWKTHNKYLRNPEVAAEYINGSLDSNDVSIILTAIRNVVDAQEGRVSGVAEKAMLSCESMYKMLSRNGNPKLAALNSLFHGLGLKISVKPDNKNYNRSHLNGQRKAMGG